MFVLVSYDVATTDKGGQRRLRRVARACLDYGQRVQYSVFECIIDPAQWVVLRQRLIDEIDPKYIDLPERKFVHSYTEKLQQSSPIITSRKL